MTNIDATMQLLKEIILLIKNVSVKADVELPSIGSSATPDVMLIIKSFESYVDGLYFNSVKHQIEIYKQLSQVAVAIQRAVVLLLPTITSSDDLKVAATSKLHLIASLGLEDAHLHESYGWS